MTDNEDLKAKMREALERKRAGGEQHPDDPDGQAGRKQKVRGPEVGGGAAPKMHRRKAGGGGS